MENEKICENFQNIVKTGDLEKIKTSLETCPFLLNPLNKVLKWPPLHTAVIFGQLRTLKYLLDKGFNPNLQDINGKTALGLAVVNSQYKIVKLLLNYSADPNMIENSGEPVLHQAICKNNEKMVKKLLKFKANCNIQHLFNGKSPLHYAIEQANMNIITVLLKFNANPTLQDFLGLTPLDLASTEVKYLISKSLKSSNDSEKSTINSPLFLPSPETIEVIPSIPIESFNSLNLSPVSNNGSFKSIDTFEKPSLKLLEKSSQKWEKNAFSHENIEKKSEINEKEFENSKEKIPEFLLKAHESRPKAFSFGGNSSQLYHWLESVRLEFLYETLLSAGYDDLEQMVGQMQSRFPITLEILQEIGIDKAGHRKRLLASLDEYVKSLKEPFKSRKAQNLSVKCCAIENPNHLGIVSVPELKDWLANLKVMSVFKCFVNSGFEDLEHNLALMNSPWPIDEHTLKDEIGIEKQGYRYRILARLQIDAQGFFTFKKISLTNRFNKDEFRFLKPSNCDSCGVF